MKNTFLYTITVLIWGSTWFAIEYQLGEVAVEVSLIYRFGLAGILILLFSKIAGLNLRFSLKQHGYIAVLGLLNFCLNYVTLYEAQKYLSSAITSIGFSMLLLMNIVNTRIFFGKKIPIKTYFGALVGISGILVLFWPEVISYQAGESTLLGLGLVLGGAFSASLGNMVSVRNSQNDFPVLQTSGWGMLYGTFFLLVFALFNQAEFTYSTQPSYWISFAYLTIFGTIVAFYSYFVLLKNIGPEKASYSIVLFPVVAVILSTLYEGFTWTEFTIGGFLLVAGGNLIVLIPAEKMKAAFSRMLSGVKLKQEPHGSSIKVKGLKTVNLKANRLATSGLKVTQTNQPS
ncbi:DMT family transporter [Aliikangiella coralliicola]|uniref:EamA family transporter n=1 Tax=Aliikangiella coralliicola TaxID=2592383 RepID=A0A545U6D9_9GAMM|nr:DMT family transporter [Aliikangiella coralliicola]TQV85038.1 EamA family transporter [Aliikangiella coralliicola]